MGALTVIRNARQSAADADWSVAFDLILSAGYSPTRAVVACLSCHGRDQYSTRAAMIRCFDARSVVNLNRSLGEEVVAKMMGEL